MVQVFGEFSEVPLNSREYMTFGFVPSFVHRRLQWRNNGLLADLLADYLTTLFPPDVSEPSLFKSQNKIKKTVSHIANELLENAMKYNDDTSDYSINIQFYLCSDRLILCLTNSISPRQVEKFQSFIQELLNTDPEELYVLQMTRSWEDENMTTSGLGLLMMIYDYGAKLGWKFVTVQKEPEIIAVTTMVQLAREHHKKGETMEITTEDYSVKYDADTATVHWQGIMRLDSKEYKSIAQFLEKIAALELPQITLDLRELEALNSSGITTLGRFLFNVGRKKTTKLLIQGDQDVAWQENSVKHFQKLVPKLQFEWE